MAWRFSIYISIALAFAGLIKIHHDTAVALEQAQAENKNLSSIIREDWTYIQSLQDRLLELNQISEQLEAEREAINNKYNQLRKQAKQQLTLTPCAGTPLPDSVLDLLQQFGANQERTTLLTNSTSYSE